MCLARSRFPVLFSLRGFLGQVFFSGHPGTLTCSFSLITFAVAMFIFLAIIKVGYYDATSRPYPIFSSNCWLFYFLVLLSTFGV